MEEDKLTNLIVELRESKDLNVSWIEGQCLDIIINEITSVAENYDEYNELNKEDKEFVFQEVLSDICNNLNI